jgi:phosphoribosyl 1,2-cyclic phosphate phosphodiesterase
MRVTILGCGPSMGVPMVGNDWGKCDPANPKNRRLRTSILMETGRHTVLVDAGPDLRQQLLAANVAHIDGLIVTHPHADHIHGIDDIRGLALHPRAPVPIHATKETLENIQGRFSYLYGGSQEPGYIARPFVTSNLVEPGMTIDPFGIRCFEQDHFVCKSLGLRRGNFAYSTDVVAMEDAAFAMLTGLDTWIVAALRHEKHVAHAHIAQVLGWVDRLKPRRTILTHMGSSLDYDTLRRELPPHVEPAYDGMVIEIDD